MEPGRDPQPVGRPEPTAVVELAPRGPVGQTDGGPGPAGSEASMAARSILFPDPEAPAVSDESPVSALFGDLNLDQIIASVTKGRDPYDLAPLFFAPLTDLDSVVFRQEVFADLEDPELHGLLTAFAHARLVANGDYRVRDLREDDLGFDHYHRERFFLNAVEQYCRAVVRLADGLVGHPVRSRGLRGLRDYLAAYVASDAFTTLAGEAKRLEDELDAIRYCVFVKGDRITVGAYDGEEDYGEQVGATFARFQQDAATDYLPQFRDRDSFAGAGVLDLVAKVFPDVFAALDAFCRTHLDYLDNTVRTVDRELQFYLSYLDYIRPIRRAGLTFSLPEMSKTSKDEQILDTFDLALAAQLTAQHAPVVCNDITLAAPERILVVSGPNNGGKTTLARTFGQLHYLARLGCPVAGREVRLFLCDHVFTHFEKEEDVANLTGKLQDELNRLKADFDQATPATIFVINEMFNSTSAEDALFLSRQILAKVSTLDALCICVTFLDELATLNDKTVSMVATVVAEDPAIRTHKVVRKAADGRAHAQAIADKYGLTFERLSKEILG